VAAETNGTLPATPGIDWICVSPKADAPLALQVGNELKLVYPQAKAPPARFEGLAFEHFYLQPLDSEDAPDSLAAVVAYVSENPRWRLSLQSHKMIGIR
jgi:organic radical activating enzyme